jgi:hypothetical protein
VFYAATAAERQALAESQWLAGWQVDIHPLIFSRSPAGFDEQTAFTLRAYRGLDWETLQRERHSESGNSGREAETATEDDPEAEA